MNIHDPQIAMAAMMLGAAIMVYALLRYRVLSQTLPATQVRTFALVFGLGWLLALVGGLSAFVN
jgi:hypothetical protein